MKNPQPLLKIRFEGDAVGPARIPVAHLLKFLTHLTKAVQRTGRGLSGDNDSINRGPQPQSIKTEVSLDLVSLTQGSPAAVLGFERGKTQESLPGMDRGLEIIEKTLEALVAIQEPATALPQGCDTGVLMAWRDAGILFSKGINRIEFTLNHRERPLKADFTPAGCTRIQERIQGPKTNIRTLEGRLLMADFKEHGTRCRIHPAVGEPMLCLFDEAQKDEVLEDMLHYVRIVGEAKEDPVTGKITMIKIHDIERLEERESESAELLPQGTLVGYGFWDSPTLEALAQAQQVIPMTDIRALFGTWPGDMDDGFEEAIDALRHSGAPV